MEYRNGNYQIQIVPPLTPAVKWLLIVTIGVWLILQVIVEQYILHTQVISEYLALIPFAVVHDFFIWQPITYMFLHALNITHILFNMLMLWWVGADLEQHWGARFFLFFYFLCGIGAALLYTFILVGYGLITGHVAGWATPVIGASGAIFGLLVAYGMIFGDRVIYFMMLFPMKARFFVMILCGILIVTLLNQGLVGGGDVANLAHLGGLVTGYVFLKFWTWHLNSRNGNKKSPRSGRRLRLVVNNDPKRNEDEDPKYWN